MQDCNKYIENVYSHPDLLKLISKIKPESIRDDLRQEVAISLLEQPCEKIAELFAGDNLLRYAIKVCWLMATSTTSPFYYKYKKSDLTKAVEYLRSTQPAPSIPIKFADVAKEHLSNKNKDQHDYHEMLLFNKFIELGSCRSVARYYGIPVNHTCNIISKVKKELKCLLFV
jgi:hypothetical protein